jgi:hypothetical protein
VEDVTEGGNAGWVGEAVPFCVKLGLRRRPFNGESNEELLGVGEVGVLLSSDASGRKMSSAGSLMAASIIIFAVVWISSVTS